MVTKFFTTTFEDVKQIKGEYVDKAERSFYGEKIDVLLRKQPDYSFTNMVSPPMSTTKKPNRVRTMTGGAVVIPDFIKGVPMHREQTLRVKDAYKVYVAVTYSAYVDSGQITRYMDKAISIINTLKKTKPVELYTFNHTMHSEGLDAYFVVEHGTKDFYEYYNVLSNVAYFRRLLFQYMHDCYEQDSRINRGGLGRPIHDHPDIKIENGVLISSKDGDVRKVKIQYFNNYKLVHTEILEV